MLDDPTGRWDDRSTRQGRRIAMHIALIDGWNVIFQVPALSDLTDEVEPRAAREELERLTLAWARHGGAGIARIFYDGKHFPHYHPGNRNDGPLEVRFVDPPAEADDFVVRDATEAARRGDRVTVVTDDKEVARDSKRAGADPISVGAFYRLLTASPPTNVAEEKEIGQGARGELAEQMLAEGEKGIDSIQVGPAVRRGPPADTKPKGPSVTPRPDRESRQKRFEAKRKRAAASGSNGRPKRKRKKKRRGF